MEFRLPVEWIHYRNAWKNNSDSRWMFSPSVKFDKKLNNLKDSIPDIIDSRIENRKDHTARSILTWIFTGAGATIIISLATAWIRSKLGI